MVDEILLHDEILRLAKAQIKAQTAAAMMGVELNKYYYQLRRARLRQIVSYIVLGWDEEKIEVEMRMGRFFESYLLQAKALMTKNKKQAKALVATASSLLRRRSNYDIVTDKNVLRLWMDGRNVSQIAFYVGITQNEVQDRLKEILPEEIKRLALKGFSRKYVTEFLKMNPVQLSKMVNEHNVVFKEQ